MDRKPKLKTAIKLAMVILLSYYSAVAIMFYVDAHPDESGKLWQRFIAGKEQETKETPEQQPAMIIYADDRTHMIKMVVINEEEIDIETETVSENTQETETDTIESHDISENAIESTEQDTPDMPETEDDTNTTKDNTAKQTPAPKTAYTPTGAETDLTSVFKDKGRINGPTGKETYYNLPMDNIVATMQRLGYNEASGFTYWERDDGVKMYGDYVMVAANLQKHPRGSIVETTMGPGIVCDTGSFAQNDVNAIDIATKW